MTKDIRVSGQGTRVYPTPDKNGLYPRVNPGDYYQLTNGDWYGITPTGDGANFQKHKVVEHDDGTITVSPSILISYLHPETNQRVECWHGYLERGYWRSC